MSLDLTLYDNSQPESEREVAWINWLRNPFGLEQWAHWNCKDDPLVTRNGDATLYYVCNHWAYDASENVDRQLFWNVVFDYFTVIARKYADGDPLYFAFDTERNRTTYITANRRYFPSEPGSLGHKIAGSIWLPDEHNGRQGDGVMLVPMDHFDHPAIDAAIHLKRYPPEPVRLRTQYFAWMTELFNFATLLRDHPEYEFSCSN